MSGDREWIHGATIDWRTKDLRFLSVSSLDLGDQGAEGCLRKWAYRYVKKIKQEEDDKQKRGKLGHARLAKFESTGDRDQIDADISRGLHMVPPPGSDLLVEWDLLLRPGLQYPFPLTEAHSPALLAGAPVKIQGVPLLGSIDLAHLRRTNLGADEQGSPDPEGTVEVIDWKFVGGDKFMKDAAELATLTQLVGYAEWVWLVRPETPFVRVSLCYFPQRGRPRKVTRLLRRQDIQPHLTHLNGVTRQLQAVAREPDIEQVPANTNACDRYGGCHCREFCTAPKRKSLTELVGQTASDWFHADPVPPPQGVIPVASLLARSGVQSQVSAAPGPDPTAVAAEKAKVEAEQLAARLRAYVPAGFVEACAKVRGFNRGFPTLVGAAARAFMAMGGVDAGPTQPKDIPGQGEIEYVKLDDAPMMAKLAEDLALDAGTSASPIPPDAPASDPRLAADPAGPAPSALSMTGQATLPGATVVQIPAMQTGPDPMKVVETEAQKPAPKKRGKKQDATPEAQTCDSADDAGLIVYVDCVSSQTTINLDDWAQQVCDTLAQKFGVVDIRCASEDTALGAGKWRGALFGMIRDPKITPLAPGRYVLETRYSAVLQVIADALYRRVKEQGGEYVRGVR